MAEQAEKTTKRTYVVLARDPADVKQYLMVGEFDATSAEGAMRLAVSKPGVPRQGRLVAVPARNWTSAPYALEQRTVTDLKFGQEPQEGTSAE